MSNPKRVKSKRTGRAGYRFRFTDPATGSRTHKTFWLPERREAERAFADHMASREAVRLGLPDNSGWQMSYDKLVEKFLAEAPISTDDRRRSLARVLKRNELKVRVVSELANLGPLTKRCLALVKSSSDVYVRDDVQAALKQMVSWAASVGVLPMNPLAEWRSIPRTSEVESRRALRPEEARAIMSAADELDEMNARSQPLSIIFRVLLVAGNRPGAVFRTCVADFDGERLHLPPPNGNKHNGAAYLVPELAQELKNYVARRKAGPRDPLLVSPKGKSLDRVNIGDDFNLAALLGFTRLVWPQNIANVEPIEVATLFHKGRPRGFDGAPPRDPKKIELRRAHVQAIESVAAEIEPAVSRLMEGVSIYALKSTHLTWARRLVNHDSVRLQMGRAPRDVDERHYLDLALVDARESAAAVWDVLVGRRSLKGHYRHEPIRIAVGAEVTTGRGGPGQDNKVDPKVDLIRRGGRIDTGRGKRESPQVKDLRADRRGAGDGIRTHDIDLGKVALFH